MSPEQIMAHAFQDELEKIALSTPLKERAARAAEGKLDDLFLRGARKRIAWNRSYAVNPGPMPPAAPSPTTPGLAITMRRNYRQLEKFDPTSKHLSFRGAGPDHYAPRAASTREARAMEKRLKKKGNQ